VSLLSRLSFDRTLRWLTALAAVSILFILAILIGQISYHGWKKLSWVFLTHAPEQGMTAGGSFQRSSGRRPWSLS
jgi:ABC-type phosphate transport system permease subunit